VGRRGGMGLSFWDRVEKKKRKEKENGTETELEDANLGRYLLELGVRDWNGGGVLGIECFHNRVWEFVDAS